MNDEQLNAIDHAQKILRGVKRYDLAALLADGGKGEAVAFAWTTQEDIDLMRKGLCGCYYPEEEADINIPLYTTPQAECAPRADAEKDAALTDDEIIAVADKHAFDTDKRILKFARAILAANKEK